MTETDETTMTVAGPPDLARLPAFVGRLIIESRVNGYLRATRPGAQVFSLGADDGEHIEFQAAITVADPALADTVERELQLILNIKD